MKQDPENAKELTLAHEPELEARLIAWIAGEAAELERAELEALVAARPELAAFKQRIELVRDLVQEASRPDSPPLRLSADKRAQLLKTLGAGADVLPLREQIVVVPKPLPWWRGKQRSVTLVMTGLAAGLAIALINIGRQPRVFEETAEIQFVQREAAPVFLKQAVDMDIRSDGGREDIAEIRRAPTSFQTGGTLLPAPPVTEGLVLSTLNEAKDASAKPNAPAIAFGGSPTPDFGSGVRGFAKESGATFDAGTGLLEPRQPARPDPASTVLGPSSIGGAISNAAPTSLNLNVAPIASADYTFNSPTAGAALAPKSILDVRERSTLGSVSTGQISLSASSTTGSLALNPAAPSPANDPIIQLDAFSISAPEKKHDASPAGATGNKVPSGAEAQAGSDAVSTFSLHVSDVSFRLVQGAIAALERGENPPEPKVRAEEIYNAFDYGDPWPSEREKIAARIEQATHPVLQERNLVRIALRVGATGRLAQQPLHLTVLLDTSGSMEREDRRAAVRRAMAELVALLGPQDRITLIGFARQPQLLAENVAGDQAAQLLRLAATTPPDGGTNLEEALKLGGTLARRHRLAEAQNRIVVLTDGAANLGDAEPARLMAAVESLRQAGIAFDACGVGLEGTGDTVLEALTRKGDGRYHVLDRPEAADGAFARKLAGAFRPAAENVKVQVRFNPARVGAYRLIGFEQHRLQEQDFRNDQVDAAELAADEAAVAMYQVESKPDGAGDVGEVHVRFRDPSTGEMVERNWTIPYEPRPTAWDRTAPSLQLATVAAMMAELLTESPVGQQVKLRALTPVASRLPALFPNQPRVAELATMLTQLRRLGHE